MIASATLKSKCAVGRWHRAHGGAPVFLSDRDRRIRVDRVDLRPMESGQAVSVYCEFQKWDDGWMEVPADPHQHYLLVGPPECLEGELWDLFDTVTCPEHFAQIEAALARGENVQSTTTFYATGYDGYIRSHDRYAWGDAWNFVDIGVDDVFASSDYLRIGTRKDGSTQKYTAWEAFIDFNTAALGAGVIVSAVSLDLWGVTNRLAVGDWNIQARVHDWGGSLTYGSKVNPGAMLYETLFAHRPSSWGFSTSGYNRFASTAAAPSSVNRTGYTRLVLATAAHIAMAPYSLSGGWVQYCDVASSGAAYKEPKLTVTYAVPNPQQPGNPGTPPTVEDHPTEVIEDPTWLATWSDSRTIDYNKRVIWPTGIALDNYATAGQVVLNCEEGVAAEERSLVDTAYTVTAPYGRLPEIGAYFDYLIPIPAGGLAMPAGTLVVALPYRMPSVDTLELEVSITSGSWTSTPVAISLPHTNDEVMMFGLPIVIPGAPPLVWGTATPDQSCFVRLKITDFVNGSAPAASTTRLYPLPIDLAGTVRCVHIGLEPDQGVTAWARSVPVVVMESPAPGSHSSPTLVSGLPVMKLTCDAIYPNDVVTVTAYADSTKDLAHAEDHERTQVDTAEVSVVTVSVMPYGSLRRYLEVGNYPYLLNPPDAAKDNAPNCVRWLPNKWYQYGSKVVPTYPWPRFYSQDVDDSVAQDGTGGGFTGATEPVWPADGSTVADGDCIWSDSGDRYLYKTNTFYRLVITSASGTELAIVELEALLDVLNPLAVDTNIAPPQLVTLADCTSDDEITLRATRGPSHEHDHNPLEVEFELVYPDGTVQTFRPGIALEQFIGRLSGS